MRNLKRVLSLALATVMLMGMMVMGASAADKKPLTDLDKVVNKDAVNLMVDLGIIVGKPDGSYAPTETVDRATMAKLVYFIMEGSDNADIYKGASTGLTDVAGNWAEGFINYCYSLGIVAGVGSNAYNPSGKVAVVSAAKMLLVALGYDAKLSKYENDSNWSINIMKDAQKAGLMENVDQNATAELTRDNAAQMIFNALMANTVEADTERDQGELYLKKYIANDTTLGYESYGLVAITAKVDSIIDGKAEFDDAAPALTGLAINGKINASASAIGQTATIYVKASNVDFTKDPITGTFKDIYTSEITGTTSNLLGSKVGATIAKMTTKSDKANYVAALADAVTFYYNGDVIEAYKAGDTVEKDEIYYSTSKKEVLKAAATTAADTDDAVIKAGVIVEFFGDSKADVVKVTEKTVKKVTGATKTKTDDDGVVTVYVPGVVGSSSKYELAKGYEDLAKDDIVLIYANSGVTYIEKAETITGTVAGRNSSNKIKIDGTYYGKTGLGGTTVTTGITDSAWTDFDNEYTFYLDNGNNIVSYKKNTDKTSSDYALVLESAFVEGNTIGSSNYMQAKMLFSDGSIEIVTVSKIGTKTVVKDAAAVGNDSANKVAYTALDVESGFFTYTVDKNDKYELKTGVAGDMKSDTSTVSNTAIKNSAKFLNNGIAILADTKTVFVVQKGTGSDATYTTYTGYNAVPGMTATSGVILYNDVTDVAKYVFLSTETFTGDVADGYIFVVNPSSNEYDPATKTYTYKTIGIDGAEDTITVTDTDVITDILGADKEDQGLVKIKTQDDDGVVSVVEEITPDALTTLSGGIIKAGANVYDYDDDTMFYVIDVTTTNAVSASEGNSIDLTDDTYTYAAAIIADGSTATIVYIVRTEKPAA